MPTAIIILVSLSKLDYNVKLYIMYNKSENDNTYGV